MIRTTKDLAQFADELAARPFIAVDTEFMREKTFWPILCLIQAAADGVEAIIDPLAEGIDLAPFLELLAEDELVKVFHAARQDIEIFYRLLDDVPSPLFDTQIAAMACGFGDQIGYEPLMRTLLKAKIDKGSRFTDWSRRPLTDAQLSYALSDVTHLRDAYPMLLDKLKREDRMHWVEEEMNALLDPNLYYLHPEDAWRRLRLKGVRPKEIGPLMKLAEWREREAHARDIPRNRILKDDAIYELSRLQPTSAKELGRARSIPSGYERSAAGGSLIDAVSQGIALDKDALPDLGKQDRQRAPADVVELLKVLLKRQCEKYGVAPKLIASSADLDAIARGETDGVPSMTGWRREVFGEAALRLKKGELAMKLNGDAVEIVET
ncbi:MAG: ribonuclease D [Pseudomonadota bacterium]